MKACEHCICKTCAIAEIHGGGPGCGDCYECEKENFALRCTNCSDYYNTDRVTPSALYYFLYKKDQTEKSQE